MHVDNPNLQPNQFNPAGGNNPRLSNMADTLEKQLSLGTRRLTNELFTHGDFQFFLTMIQHKDPALYQRLVHNPHKDSYQVT